MRQNDFHPFSIIVNFLYFADLCKMLSLNNLTTSHQFSCKIRVLSHIQITGSIQPAVKAENAVFRINLLVVPPEKNGMSVKD